MALGRGMNVDGMMPKSISDDVGKSWQVSASPFAPLSGGQRMALMRLKEGPLFLASFADKMTVIDASGNERDVSGLFGALSFDDGVSWPVRRLITDDGPDRKLNGGAWTGEFVMSGSTAEPKGYMSVCQTPDGAINLISSALHYQFNIAWLKRPMPALNR
jgi:sulfatase modifying factor 1